jgi:hypothetical protein
MMKGGVLSIDRAYFAITGGRERWLYKVARKHAGGAGEAGFAISMPVLFEKSGAEGQYRRFKFEMLKLAEKNDLPGYALSIETSREGEPMLRMRRVDGKDGAEKMRDIEPTMSAGQGKEGGVAARSRRFQTQGSQETRSAARAADRRPRDGAAGCRGPVGCRDARLHDRRDHRPSALDLPRLGPLHLAQRVRKLGRWRRSAHPGRLAEGLHRMGETIPRKAQAQPALSDMCRRWAGGVPEVSGEVEASSKNGTTIYGDHGALANHA